VVFIFFSRALHLDPGIKVSLIIERGVTDEKFADFYKAKSAYERKKTKGESELVSRINKYVVS